MEAALFAKMMSDKSVTDLKKLGYKYPQADIAEFIGLLKTGFYTTLPMKDFNGEPLVYLESVAQVHLSAAKILLTPHNSSQHYGIKAMEDEIVSTLTIEQIDTSRDSVRRILTGYAPASETENRIYGMKKGVEFIADPNHRITEENLHQLYDDGRGLPGRRRSFVARQLLPSRQRLCRRRQSGAYGAALEETAGIYGGFDRLCKCRRLRQ